MKLSDIAQLAGVSKTTASYILSGKGEQYRISQETQDRVWQLARQHNYTPNLAARSLRIGTSRLIGVVLPSLHEPKTVQSLARIEKLARSLGFRLLISCSDSSVSNANALISDMIKQVDITILFSEIRCGDTLQLNTEVTFLKADKLTRHLVETALSSDS
ncbi:LacI family DNA-binding transcriptional regulator [Vibrio galatheae]|uniref:LacI family DNA-binding transcriptional regulator n=1 Tax=Vibrio galatheae TaxID=579748 RepID=UPI000695C2D7|nr:LacI family DNA-binding transcriptional regulator [Vibrio galatheae]